MKILRALPAAVLLAACVSSGAAAQEASPVREGMRVRVAAPVYHVGQRVQGTSRWIVGTVRQVTHNSLVLQTDSLDPDSRTEIPFDAIRGAEVSEGITDQRSSVRRNAFRGALAGASTSAFFYGLMAVLPQGGPRQGELLNTRPGVVARNTAILVAGGAGAGALIGKTAREKWRGVSFPRVALESASGGTGISFSLDF